MRGRSRSNATKRKITNWKEQIVEDSIKVATLSELSDRAPAYALAGEVDLVVIRFDDQISVLYGRCLHRGALLSDGHVKGDNLYCGVHNWDFRIDTGVSEYNNKEALHRFEVKVVGDDVFVSKEQPILL